MPHGEPETRKNSFVSKLINSVIDRPWLWGFSSAILVILLLGIAFDLSARCLDGWESSSIGTQGACSHHGGVIYPYKYATLFFLFIVFFPHLIRWYHENKEKDINIDGSLEKGKFFASEVETKTPFDEQKSAPTDVGSENMVFAPDNISPCPIHGTMVLSKDATRWTCTEYPTCQYYLIK